MRKLFKSIITAVFVSFVLTFSIPVFLYAASQGSIGTTSTGTTDITLTISDLVDITALTDINVTPSDYSVDNTGYTNACIYSNQTTIPGGYAVTVTSANATGTTFRTRKGATADYAVYTATWDDDPQGTPSPTSLDSGVKLTGQTGADQGDITCAGTSGYNARFEITFTAAVLQAAPAGTYTDTATIVISPT